MSEINRYRWVKMYPSPTVKPKCKHCPRDAKEPFDVLDYCYWHWELEVLCQICFEYHDTSQHSDEKLEHCVTSLCPNKAQLPPKDPKLCITCFTKVSDGSLKRCPNSLVSRGVDRCCLCFEFTMQGVFSTITYAAHQLTCCVTCGLDVANQHISEHLPTALTPIVADYVWSTLKVNSKVGQREIITKVDFPNGLYFVTNLYKHQNLKGCPHTSDGYSCKYTKRYEMASVHNSVTMEDIIQARHDVLQVVFPKK